MEFFKILFKILFDELVPYQNKSPFFVLHSLETLRIVTSKVKDARELFRQKGGL